MRFDRADFYDAELRWYNARFREAVGAGLRDRVLDVGCGAGQSTRDAARAAREGSALGVDTSPEMLKVARRRGAEEGLRNLAFEQGDAQVHPFPEAHFDLCISRFGVMFFADPAVAFANIGRALRPGARLVALVWQAQASNEWSTAARQALGPAAAASAGLPNPFSLGDPEAAARILSEAGFGSIDFADVREPVFYGPDVEAAYEALTHLWVVEAALAAPSGPPEGALRRLRELAEAHLTPEGVLFDSRAWIITARRAA